MSKKSFILASTNKHKLEEINDFPNQNYQLVLPSEKLAVEETGTTFEENALIKAKAYYDKFKKPSMSDDSGLVVNALPNILGIYSARFAPECPEQADKNLKLIELVSTVTDRSAYFKCVLCFYLSPDQIYFFEGVLEGEIATKPSGEGGFGYDPIFLPMVAGKMQDKSLAELSEWKQLNSHRGKALQSAQKFFQYN